MLRGVTTGAAGATVGNVNIVCEKVVLATDPPSYSKLVQDAVKQVDNISDFASVPEGRR